ncbi:hypothetical protein BH10BAC2_BH10BAC2_29680 [soil metagenome]
MRKIFLLLCSSSLLMLSCQKSLSVETYDNGTEGGNGTDSTGTTKDTFTYEVVTKDTGGWYGIWVDENGDLAGSGRDSGSFGTAIYFKSGWKYSFVPKQSPFQMMMSVDAKYYTDNVTINFYKNGQLVKTRTNDPISGFSKLLWNAVEDTLTGTVQDPLLTYEVLLSNMDTSKFESDGWWGGWINKNGDNTFTNNPLAMDFAIPSGWRYNFHVASLPFTMSMQTSPYTKGGSTVILNFYVDNILVKTNSSNDLIYPPLTYTVQ